MAHRIEGKVVSISDEGNLVTDIPNEQLMNAPAGEAVTVRCDEHITHGIFGPDHSEPDFTLIALRGAAGTLELCIVGDSAKIMLGVRVGEKVTVDW
ncbi:MAG: hypothetical protein KDA55_19940 [Planctomycetales bacterium]|nr:hypothetical protein [Planctomycetales bacterium]